MKKLAILTLLLSIGLLPIYAQQPKKTTANRKTNANPLSFHGKLFDLFTMEEPVGSVSEVLSLPDSVLVSTSRSQGLMNGNAFDDLGYHFTISDRSKKYAVRITKDGFLPCYIEVDPSKYSNKVSSVMLDPVYLERKSKTLDEVKVTASKVKFYHRGDTLVYNADAFVLPEGSMLDALIEQLPGVKLDNNGIITVNGRKVDFLLLDGKEFFNNDNKLMLKNLAAYTVKNVEVYQSDRERFAGTLPRGEKATLMDVKLKKEYQVGYMGNIEAGYGTSGRYMGRLFAMGFTQSLRLTLIGNANNLNDDRRPAQQGTWTPSSVKPGRKDSYQGGIDYYYDGKDRNFSVRGNVIAGHERFKDRTSTNVTNFLPQGNNYSYRFINRFRRNYTLSTENIFHKETKTWSLSANLRYHYNKERDSDNDMSVTSDRELQDAGPSLIENLYSGGFAPGTVESIINRRISSTALHGNTWDGYARIAGTYKFLKHGTRIGASAIATYKSAHILSNELLTLNFRDNAVSGMSLNRQFDNFPNHSLKAQGEVSYMMPLGSYAYFTMEYDYTHNRVAAQSEAWLYDEILAGERIVAPSARELVRRPDADNSYDSRSYDNTHTLHPQLSFQKDRWYLFVKVPVNLENRRLSYKRAAVDTLISHSNILPKVNATLRYTKDWMNDYVMFIYNFSPSSPALLNFVRMTDATDPMNIHTGAESLKNPGAHDFNLVVSKPLGKKGTQDIEASFSLFANQLAQGFEYNAATGVRIYKPCNVNGNRNWNASYAINLPLDKKRMFELQNKLAFAHNTSVDLMSEDGMHPVESRVYSMRWKDNIELKYNFSKNRISVFGSGAVNRFTGSLDSFSSFTPWDINYGVRGSFKLPYNFGITTDFTVYMRRGYNDSVLNTDNFVWNARLSWSTLKGNLLFMADGWDILHDIKNVTYKVNAQARTETYTTVLPRYFMFHIQYRFNKQPKKK